MARKRTITITVETDQLLMVRNHIRIRAWCETCNEHTEHATLEELWALEAQNADVHERLLAIEKLHSVSASDGSLRICLPSFLRQNSGNL